METINNKPFTDFNATFISFLYAFNDTQTNLLRMDMRHINQEQVITTKEQDLVVVFESEDDIARFYKELLSGSKIDIGDGYIYDCKLMYTQPPFHIGRLKYEATFTLSVIKTKDMITENTTGNGYQFDVEGMHKASAIYEIKALSNLSEIDVDGFKVKNVNANDVFVIDGIKGLVYRRSEPDVSAFDDTELLSFPKLEPGTHTIKCNSNQVEITIKYYPIYL